MRMQVLILNSALIAALSALFNVATPQRAAACSCLEPTVESSYNNATDVAYVDIRWSYVFLGTRYFEGRVQRTFKGCLREGQRVLLTTPAGGESCGASLRRGLNLINGTATDRTGVLSISLCSYDMLVSQLTEHDRAFLDGRTVCCGDSCACADGTQPVVCLVDPCSVPPACGEGKCVANYCGGCNAEFYNDAGERVCEDKNECQSDEDCAKGNWCRQKASDGTTEPRHECVPFVGDGQRCNGFTLPWLYERCEPSLTCDTPDYVADAPGVCRKSCESDKDCDEGSYCAGDKLCDTDGACEREVDCNLPGNNYPHIECVGYGVCSLEGRCGYECGVPECVDLSGLNFGPCDAILGWGVVDGRCAELSGCSAGDFKLFASGDECRKTCEAPRCDDLSGVDFGPCKRLLGAGVIAGECVAIGGCDTMGYSLFPDVESCQKSCPSECKTDSECKRTGCSGQICAATDVITTCEYRDEYACYDDPEVTRCGCFVGKCAWDATDELAQCIEDARGTP